MDICVFYSWQSDYPDDCKQFIGKAINEAVSELNEEQQVFNYYVVRGGGGLIGSQEINEQIDNALRFEACLVISDYTHVGAKPQKNSEGEWIKRRALPNPNVIDETARAKERVGTKQIIKVNNTFYGDYNKNIEMYFDIQNERFPLGYFYHKTDDTDIKQKKVFRNLKTALKESIVECKDEFLKNQKVRFSPLVPLTEILKTKLFSTPFLPAEKFKVIKSKIEEGKSFRLLALPGIGKTRMVCEAFRDRDMNIFYCDGKNRSASEIKDSFSKLLDSSKELQTVVVDNCDQSLHSALLEESVNHDTPCQLITLYYNVREIDDSDVDVLRISPKETPDVIRFLLDSVPGISEEDKDAILDIAGGFPLMVNLLIEQYHQTGRISSVSRAELFNRMLSINDQVIDGQEKKKVMIAFSIFKFIGLFDREADQGRFIANNQILTPLLYLTAGERFQRFLQVYGEFSKGDILEREGNYVLMRPVPLAIYLAKIWYQQQTVETISTLVEQINALKDERTKNLLIESLSRRITLMSDVPLAQDFVAQLLNPINGPFLSEEVVLTKQGSRLFLAFSEVNPEACATALLSIISNKTDESILSLKEERRNLSWALDHLAFDRRSFKNAMLTLARFSLVETEEWLSNNTTGLFIERFPVFLPGTEASLNERLDVIYELRKDGRYKMLIRKSMIMGLNLNHDYRSGGAEKQGMRRLVDYVPKSYKEVLDYFSKCFNILLSISEVPDDFKEIGSIIVSCSRQYYLRGFESFLFEAISVLAPRFDYDWEEMKIALDYLLKYDAPKRNFHLVDDIRALREQFTKDDFVYRLLHVDKVHELDEDLSFEDELRLKQKQYSVLANEFVDNQLYTNEDIMSSIIGAKCMYYTTFGIALSAYSATVGVQKDILNILLNLVLSDKASRDGESLLIYFISNVEDKGLLYDTYERIKDSKKTRLLASLYAIKSEEQKKIDELFELLDNGLLQLNDFSEYFNHLPLSVFDIKYIARRLIDRGPDGAWIVMTHCHRLIFGENLNDADYEKIARDCLLRIDVNRAYKDVYTFLDCMNNYLINHRDEELAWRIQVMQEESLESNYSEGNYYIGRLYSKVLKSYPDLLKPRVFELLEISTVRHSWFNLLRTDYSRVGGDGPIYTLISSQEWFEWLDSSPINSRVYAVAMIFSLSKGNEANPDMLRLIEGYWSKDVMSALDARMHSFSWAGSGIPLYRSRIDICNDYISKLTNKDAIEWFKSDIEYWKKEIENELLQNAHDRAIYD